jgi:2-octaprenyl-6-methoxyphenol hydroxylase
MTQHVDIAVIGGGPIGLAFALAAQQPGRQIVVLEANAGAGSDTRTLALAEGSRLILNAIGAWSAALNATPITSIHISHRGGFGQSILRAAESNVPAMGYTLSYRALVSALLERACANGLPILDCATVTDLATTASSGTVKFLRNGAAEILTAKLVVVADGGRTLTQFPSIKIQQKDYGQTALLARISSNRAHGNIAYERFTSTGPVALLPVAEEFGLVWTVSPSEAERINQRSDAEFIAEFQAQFGDFAGKFSDVHSRFQFPLRLRYADKTTSERTVLIGNAAQALHPVAGQGFNLGLRDADELARLLCTVPSDGDCGELNLLRRYQRQRLPDTRLGIFFTDALVRGFSNDNPLIHLGRGVALAALQLAPFARRHLAQAMMFGRS